MYVKDQFRYPDTQATEFPTFVCEGAFLPHFEQGPEGDAAANQRKLLDPGFRSLFENSACAVDSGL